MNEKDFDIDTILETQTLDQFLESMYKKEPPKTSQESSTRIQTRRMMKEQGGNYEIGELYGLGKPKPKLDFDSEDVKLQQAD